MIRKYTQGNTAGAPSLADLLEFKVSSFRYYWEIAVDSPGIYLYFLKN